MRFELMRGVTPYLVSSEALSTTQPTLHQQFRILPHSVRHRDTEHVPCAGLKEGSACVSERRAGRYDVIHE